MINKGSNVVLVKDTLSPKTIKTIQKVLEDFYSIDEMQRASSDEVAEALKEVTEKYGDNL